MLRCFISALTGQRVPKVLESVREVYSQTSRRITTGLLNDILADATTALQLPYISGRRLKIYYATQQSVCPPTFVLFVNDEKLMHFAYQRYLKTSSANPSDLRARRFVSSSATRIKREMT